MATNQVDAMANEWNLDEIRDGLSQSAKQPPQTDLMQSKQGFALKQWQT